MNRIAPRPNDLESLTPLAERRFAARLFGLVKGVKPCVVLVGGTPEQATAIQMIYGRSNVRQYSAPLGFAADPAAVAECIQFVESQSPFRFCFLAVESPQQEALASLLRERGIARGLALCVGTSLDCITGGAA